MLEESCGESICGMMGVLSTEKGALVKDMFASINTR
jgi:hypothetical protein